MKPKTYFFLFLIIAFVSGFIYFFFPSKNSTIITPSLNFPSSPLKSSPTPTPTVTLPTSTPFPPFAELPTSEVSYLIPLTLQQVSERSAQLLFELDHAATGDLLLRMVEQGNNYVQSIPIFPNLTNQQINLGPLEPGTAYEVVLGLRTPDGSYAQPAFLGDAWGSLRFHIQPTAEPLRVGVIGDSGFGEPVTAQLAGLMAGERLDFVIHTGDLVCNQILPAICPAIAPVTDLPSAREP